MEQKMSSNSKFLYDINASSQRPQILQRPVHRKILLGNVNYHNYLFSGGESRGIYCHKPIPGPQSCNIHKQTPLFPANYCLDQVHHGILDHINLTNLYK